MLLSQRKRRHIHYVYRGSGIFAVIGWAVRSVISPLYQRDVRYIIAQKIPSRPRPDSGEEEKTHAKGKCVTVESLEALRLIEKEIPPSFTYSLEDFRAYLTQGCVVFLVFESETEGRERALIGYGVYQRGVIAILGREKKSPFDLLFGRFREMLPEYRGQRYSDILRETREEYCRRNGVKFLGGTIAPDNRPSLKSSLTRGGYQIVGTVERVSLLKGCFVWATPWEQIEATLQEFIQRETQA